MKASMEPLLYAAGGDIMFAGHVFMLMDARIVSAMTDLDLCGVVQVTIGDGGNREGLAHRYRNQKPQWSVFREASFGHGELKIVNATHAVWSWHRNDNEEPIKSDELWISSLASTGCVGCTRHEFRKILAVR